MQVISEFLIQFCIRRFFLFKSIQVYCIYHTQHNGIHTAVTAKISAFWVIMPWNLVDIYRCFKGTCCLNWQGAKTHR